MNKKKIIVFLAVWFLLCIPVCFVVKNSAIPVNKVTDFSKEITYHVEDIQNYQGYEIENNTFELSGYDPGFYLENLNQKLAAVQLVFSQPLESNMEMQVFYQASGEGISEENSIKKFLYKGNQEIFIPIPSGEYELLRFDIEGSFQLQEINLSSEELELQYTGDSQIMFVAYVVAAVFLFVILAIAFWGLHYPEKLMGYLKGLRRRNWSVKHNKYQYICTGIYALLFILLLIFYKMGYTHLTPNRYVLVLQLVCVSAIYYIILNLRKMKENMAKVVFVLVLAAGFCYAVTLPVATNVSTDDETHYRKVVCLSHIFDGYVTEADEAMYMKEYLPEYTMQNILDHNTELQNLSMNGQTVEIDRTPSEIYISLSYIPSAIALMFGRGIGASFAMTFLFGRLINVFVYAVVMYYAIKKLRSGKLILSVIALLPTNIFMSASYGYDAWLTAFSALAVSYIISVVQEKEHQITYKEVLIIMLAFIFGFAPKAVYFPLFGLCFIITSKHFGSKKSYKRYLICTVVCALIVLSTFLIPFVVGGPGAGDVRGGADVNATEQVFFILKNPLEYTKILLNHLETYLSVEQQSQLIASTMHMGISPHFVLIYLTLVAAMFADRSPKDDEANHMAIRIWTLIVSLAAVVLVSTALYVSFTAVGSPVIQGCQYRYLMPLLFPVCYFVFNIKITNRANKNAMYTLGLAIMFMALVSTAGQNWIQMYM